MNGGPETLYRVYEPHLRPQLTKQWNVFVERKLTDSVSAQVGYVGSRSSHMVVPFDFNQPRADPGPVETWRPVDERRPLYPLNPEIGMTSGTNSIGVGAYDALQASVRQRPTQGLEFLASYTYGKALSDSVGYYGVGWSQTGGQGYYYLDSDHPERDYGPPPYDMRHNFSLSAIFELPFGKQRKFGQAWSGATQRCPGRVEREHDLPGTHRPGADSHRFRRPIASGTAPRDDELSEPRLQRRHLRCGRRRRVDRRQLLSASAERTSWGLRRRHSVRSWILELDLGLAKDFHINAGRYLTFKIEAFNVLNHPNFALQAGSADISSPTTFGRIQNTFSAPRVVELVVKFNF